MLLILYIVQIQNDDERLSAGSNSSRVPAAQARDATRLELRVYFISFFLFLLFYYINVYFSPLKSLRHDASRALVGFFNYLVDSIKSFRK